MKLFRKREPTMKNEKIERRILQMVTTYSDNYYAFDGKLYKSDIVRACIRPKVKAIGKLSAKHIRDDGKEFAVNPQPYIRYLLEEPNPLMTGQQMQEKVATQLCLNNNAFILIVRDENGKPMQLYPIPCVLAETVYKNDTLHIRFTFKNGKTNIFPYSELIHLRHDFNEDDIFGESPAPALAQMMEVISTADQGLVKAIKNSGIVRWLLKFNYSMRPEDLKDNVKNFVDNYLSVDSDTFGAAGVDSKADAIRIEPKDYVPNALQSKEAKERIYSFFNTNEQIVQSKWTEDEWNAYYESEIEADAIQLSNAYTIRLFTRTERNYGNRIIFEAANLQCASLGTKLNFVQMVDRGGMLVNEWRAMFNLGPIEGGNKPIRRLDTQVVDLIENTLNKMNSENYVQMTAIITQLLAVERRNHETHDQHQRSNYTE